MDKVSTLIHSLFHLYIYYHLLKIKVEGIFCNSSLETSESKFHVL